MSLFPVSVHSMFLFDCAIMLQHVSVCCLRRHPDVTYDDTQGPHMLNVSKILMGTETCGLVLSELARTSMPMGSAAHAIIA